jgi:hypothetical protein
VRQAPAKRPNHLHITPGIVADPSRLEPAKVLGWQRRPTVRQDHPTQVVIVNGSYLLIKTSLCFVAPCARRLLASFCWAGDLRTVFPIKYYKDEGFVERKIEINDEDLDEIIEEYLREHGDFDFDEIEIVNNRPMNIWLHAKCRTYIDTDNPDEPEDMQVSTRTATPHHSWDLTTT